MLDKSFRKPHFLAKNVGNKIPSNFIFFDTEAAIFQDVRREGYQEQTLSFGVHRYVELARTKIKTDLTTIFETAVQFWDYVYGRCNQKKLLYLFAHNTRYDMQLLNINKEIEEGRIKVDFAVAKKGCYILKGDTANGPIAILDSMNYWDASLSKLGDAIGRPKTEMPAVLDDISKWQSYCINDVDIVTQAILGLLTWIKQDDLGNFKFTAASQSFAIYRHSYMDIPILIHGHKKAVDLERKSFRAGRCSLFRYGDVNEPIYYLDVNSLYANVMLSQSFPCRLIDHDIMVGLNDDRLKPGQFGKIARVVVHSENHEYPLWTKDGVKYCVGEFTTILAGPELDQALLHSEITSIGEICFYECQPIFSRYMTYLLDGRSQYRKQGNKLREWLCKTFANALFGKFGQKSYRWYDTPNEWSFEGEDSWIVINDECESGKDYRMLGGKVQSLSSDDESLDSFPAIAAFVTSYGRLYMDMLREVSGEKTVIMQYIDALHVTQTGMDNLSAAGLLDSIIPGKLKVESVYKKGIYHSAHDYEVDLKHVICGVPTRAVEIEDGVFLYDQFDCGEPILKSATPATVIVRRIERSMERRLPDSQIGQNGWLAPVDAGGF